MVYQYQTVHVNEFSIFINTDTKKGKAKVKLKQGESLAC